MDPLNHAHRPRGPFTPPTLAERAARPSDHNHPTVLRGHHATLIALDEPMTANPEWQSSAIMTRADSGAWQVTSRDWGDVLRRATAQLHEFNRLAAIEVNAVRWLTKADIDRARREREATRMRRYGLDPKWDTPAPLIPAAQPRSGVRGLRPADIMEAP